MIAMTEAAHRQMLDKIEDLARRLDHAEWKAEASALADHVRREYWTSQEGVYSLWMIAAATRFVAAIPRENSLDMLAALEPVGADWTAEQWTAASEAMIELRASTVAYIEVRDSFAPVAIAVA